MKHQKSDNPLLDELVSQLKSPEDFRNLQDQLLKRGIEALLKAEMNHHLGRLYRNYSSFCNNLDGFRKLLIQGIEVIVKK